jgi:CheY-like chemotaxis protein
MQRILIIDDDDLVLKTFALVVKRAGYDVLTATGYEEALKIINSERLDLVLSDIRMPERNGVETIKSIQDAVKKAGYVELPIIFITGYAEMSDELQANFLGEVLYKPIDVEHLLTTIRDYL